MALDGYKNLALGQVATAPSPPTTGLSLALQAGQGVYFPAPPFNCTVWPASAVPTPANAEIIRVTAMSGDTFTAIARTQETALGGPATARTIAVGDYVALTFSAKWIADLTNADNLDSRLARRDQANTFTASPQAIAGTNPELQLRDTSQPVDARLFRWVTYAQVFEAHALNDAATTIVATPLSLRRNGDARIGQDLYEKGRSTALGSWIAVPYSAGNFSSDSGTWVVDAGDVLAYAYTLIGATLVLTLNILTSTITGAPTTLYVQLPAGLTCGRRVYAAASLYTGSYEVGFFLSIEGEARVRIQRLGGAAWPAVTNGINLNGTLTIPLN